MPHLVGMKIDTKQPGKRKMAGKIIAIANAKYAFCACDFFCSPVAPAALDRDRNPKATHTADGVKRQRNPSMMSA